MDIFEALLKNASGFPPEVLKDLRGNAETLQFMSGFAKFDLQKETQHVLDNLPELREQRARQIGREAAQEKSRKERERMTLEAARLRRSAEKLRSPDADEQFKRRAALVELFIHMKARLRDTVHVIPELDPVRLEKFNVALGVIAKGLPGDVGTRVDREQMARMVFVQELREAGGNVDHAVDNLYKSAFQDTERGHWGDAGLERVVKAADREADFRSQVLPAAQQTQDYVYKKILEEVQIEHDAAVAQNATIQALPKLAVEYLNPKQYAAYRTLIDNEHLIDWKIDENGKVHFKANTLDAGGDSNTVGKILQRDLNYQNIRGANLLIQNTVTKLNGLMHEHAGHKIKLTEKGLARMKKTTLEVVSDPEAQARKSNKKGKGGPER